MCRRRGLGAHYVTILTWDSHFNLPNLEIKEVSVCDSKTSNNTEASDYVQGLEINQNIDFYIGMKAGNVGIPPLNWGKPKECRSCQGDNRDFFFLKEESYKCIQSVGGILNFKMFNSNFTFYEMKKQIYRSAKNNWAKNKEYFNWKKWFSGILMLFCTFKL